MLLMRAQILLLTMQLAELQTAPAVAPSSAIRRMVDQTTNLGQGKLDAFANDFEVATAVLSRLKGPVVGRYTQIKKYFKPQAERDWACQQIRTFKQGNMRMDDFVTRFLALSIQGGLGNEHAVELLERNVNPHIAEQLYIQDMRSNNLSQAAEEVQKIGRAIELYKMQFGGGPTTKNNYSQRHLGHQTKLKIILTGSSCLGCNQSREPLWISAQSRKNRSADSRAAATIAAKRDTCPKTVETGRRPPNKKNNQGCQVHQLETEKPDNWLQTLASCLYDEIQAFFYDQQVTEMKAQGKEFGA
ncbi:hypothetical protein SERLA73DRAFT_75583 [Serpula lacrymans var. lacrymans S7.3]|uniref:Retrotransposon gag domain-containing protein n=1 Tax=Serpula lacrymans var. lacrymans (strain S7.3) TaxID=936435 RepID=F8Q583_SERL3|nr:hypothetical protein SERLA73DRAFT_75583 [Serpula lacrymans var. lacrymans S7.3]